MIVVAPNEVSLEKVKKDLLNHIQASSEKFVATSPAFDVQGAALTGRAVPKQWILVSRYTVRNPSSRRFEMAFRLAHSRRETRSICR